MARALIMTSVLLILAGFISTRDDQRAMGPNVTPQSTQNPKVTLPVQVPGVQPSAAALESHARHVSSRLKTLANALGIDTAAHIQEASALTQISQ